LLLSVCAVRRSFATRVSRRHWTSKAGGTRRRRRRCMRTPAGSAPTRATRA
jgi:hypothetical protein